MLCQCLQDVMGWGWELGGGVGDNCSPEVLKAAWVEDCVNSVCAEYITLFGSFY